MVLKDILRINTIMPYFLSRENTKVLHVGAVIDKKFNYKPRLGLATMPCDRQEYRIYPSYFDEVQILLASSER